jgi:hypothetical protein
MIFLIAQAQEYLFSHSSFHIKYKNIIWNREKGRKKKVARLTMALSLPPA